MKMYKTCFDEIKTVEVQRETESSVFMDGIRHAKMSSFESFFHTFDDAKSHLEKKAFLAHESAKRNLDRKRSELEKVMQLKEEK